MTVTTKRSPVVDNSPIPANPYADIAAMMEEDELGTNPVLGLLKHVDDSDPGWARALRRYKVENGTLLVLGRPQVKPTITVTRDYLESLLNTHRRIEDVLDGEFNEPEWEAATGQQIKEYRDLVERYLTHMTKQIKAAYHDLQARADRLQATAKSMSKLAFDNNRLVLTA